MISYRCATCVKVSPRQAYDELMNELRLWGVQHPVISSNAPLRRDGTPYADALDDPLDDPGVALFFTRKKRAVCVPCDTFRLPFENIRAIGLSVKAMRDMERRGVDQILDQMFEGFTTLPPPDAAGKPW